MMEEQRKPPQSISADVVWKDEQPQRKPITCEIQHRKLAYISADGIFLYCKSCRVEHRISWQRLEVLHKNAVEFNIALEIHQSV